MAEEASVYLGSQKHKHSTSMSKSLLTSAIYFSFDISDLAFETT